MTDNTPPEALRLANVCSNLTRYPMDAHLIAAELRRQHARIAELEAQLEAIGAGGVQALSAAPEAIAKLRHLYQNMVNGAVRDTASAKRIAEGLLAPAIEALERERDHWRERARTMEEHQRGTVWYWQGDGNDHPESMVNSLPVVIRADQLRALIAGGVQALSAAPAGFVPVSAFDRLHAHAESLAARLLAAEQATPKAAPVSSDTLYLLRRLLSNQHTLTGPEFRAELEKIVGEAYQQEAQEPSHQETVDVVGVRSNGEHVNLGKIAMPPRMKAREIAIEQFGRFKDDDGSDAEMCFGALEYFLEWLIQQGWSKAPQPAPAPLIARSLAEWHEEDGYVAWWAWNGREWAGEPAWIGTPNCEDWPGYHTHWTPHPEQPVCAALAAQGGK